MPSSRCHAGPPQRVETTTPLLISTQSKCRRGSIPRQLRHTMARRGKTASGRAWVCISRHHLNPSHRRHVAMVPSPSICPPSIAPSRPMYASRVYYFLVHFDVTMAGLRLYRVVAQLTVAVLLDAVHRHLDRASFDWFRALLPYPSGTVDLPSRDRKAISNAIPSIYHLQPNTSFASERLFWAN
jgi:hypothetical protein